MSAPITCPHCQSRFKGKPDLAGKKIKCPSCQSPFTAPAETATRTPKPKSPAVEPPTDDAAYGVSRIDITPRCPHCAAEMLSAEAIICVHCGYNTMTRVHGATKKVLAASPQEHLLYLLPSLSAALVFVAIVVALIFYNTVLTQRLEGGKLSWIVHESLRMWTTLVCLAILWPVAMFAFNTLAVRPRPPEEVLEGSRR